MPELAVPVADQEGVIPERARFWLQLYLSLLVLALAGDFLYLVCYGSDAHGGGHAEALPVWDSIFQYLKDNLHKAPEKVQAIAQIVLVVLISVLWFSTFRLTAALKNWNWLRQCPAFIKRLPLELVFGLVAVIPALWFAGLMYKAYQPAVFVMALVAIFVAAQHYGELEIQLESQEKDHERQQERLDKALDRIEKIEKQTETLLNDAGLAKFKKEVYAAYRAAKFHITAVVRVHDIDDEWWMPARADGAWNTYADTSASESSPTLLRALSDLTPGAEAIFVSDLPMPGSDAWAKAVGGRTLFRDLLGLAWELVVMAKADEERMRAAGSLLDFKPMRGYISRPLAWMHVVDNMIFQVIWRDTYAQSAVRRLDEDLHDLALRRRLSEGAREEIKRYAQRGCGAEEYLFSVLRYAAMQAADGKPDDEGAPDLAAILDVLGMSQWASDALELEKIDPAREVHVAMGQRISMTVFEELLRVRWKKTAIRASASDDPSVHSLSELAHELV